MDRRSFFRIFAALPVVGVAAMASAVKEPEDFDHVLKGKVLIEGALVVNGIETGTALVAGDYTKNGVTPYAGGVFRGAPKNQPQREPGMMVMWSGVTPVI